MMQMNGKEFKVARDTLALWHIADFNKADETITKGKNINNFNSMIETDKGLIVKMRESKVNTINGKTENELLAEIADFEARKVAEVERVKKLYAEYTKDIESGRALVTDSLKKAISEYVLNIFDASKETILVAALVDWFTNLGAKGVDEESVKPYMRALGVKRNSARKMCENVKHNGVASDKVLVDTFLGAICDEPTMASLLPIKKWENIIEKKAKADK